jgi:hypothetical protein
MATVTPNFNWPVPTSTDLVKDGATAIEALGDSIDASLVDLKGGTTGQVLSKTTGTDMDFTWVDTDDTNAIQNAIVNAKGDIIGASANDVPAITSVGADGETLVADSSTSTGLRYTGGTVQANPVLNSAFQVWQRGTSVAITSSSISAYQADRWQGYRGATGGTVSRQVTGDTTNLPNVQYCGRIQRDSGNTSTAAFYLTQSFETINSIPFAGKTVTFSFYARAGANYSATSSALGVYVASGTGTDQNQGAGYTGQVGVINTSATLTTTWQRFTYTGSVGATATELAVQFSFTPTGTAGAADFFEVTGVQIDIGSVALPFRTYAGTIQMELAAASRYYYRFNSGNAYGNVANSGYTATTTQVNSFVQFPVTMRTIPTSIDSSGIGWIDVASATGTASGPSFAAAGTTYANVSWTTTGATANRFAWFRDSAGTGAGYLGFSAEL